MLHDTFSLSRKPAWKISCPYTAAPHTTAASNASGDGPHDEFSQWHNLGKNHPFLGKVVGLFWWGFFPFFFLIDSLIQLRHCKQLYQKSWGDGRTWHWGRNKRVGTTTFGTEPVTLRKSNLQFPHPSYYDEAKSQVATGQTQESLF